MKKVMAWLDVAASDKEYGHLVSKHTDNGHRDTDNGHDRGGFDIDEEPLEATDKPLADGNTDPLTSPSVIYLLLLELIGAIG